MAWNFDETMVEERDFDVLPVGEYRIRFNYIEPTTTKNGDEMWKITFDVSGKSQKLFYNLVFLSSNPKITNGNLAQIYDSFGIPKGNMNPNDWIGKVGACKVKHREYEGEKYANVSWFIKREKQDKLPAWVEGNKSVTAAAAELGLDINIAPEDLPF